MSSKTWTFKFETDTRCNADELIFQAIKDHVRGSEGFKVSVWDNQIMADYGVQFVWEEDGERFEKPGTYFHHDACGEQEEEEGGEQQEFEWIEESLHSL